MIRRWMVSNQSLAVAKRASVAVGVDIFMTTFHPAPHPGDQALDVAHGRPGQHAVAEVEDMGAGRGKSLEDAVGFLIEAGSAGDERQWIEIALEREPPGQGSVGDLRFDGRVEADRADVGQGGEFRQLGSRRRAEKR